MSHVSYETEIINQNQLIPNQRGEIKKKNILFEFKNTHDLPHSFHVVKWKEVLDIFKEQKA